MDDVDLYPQAYKARYMGACSGVCGRYDRHSQYIVRTRAVNMAALFCACWCVGVDGRGSAWGCVSA